METEKLYYSDCLLRSFTAQVLSCREAPGGYEVILSATAFYPEGGGQACDLGTINGVTVLDVQEKGEQIVHLCSSPLEAGTTVTGQIDWARRFDLMQQHSGEHIVSGLVHRQFGYHNVGFHVGAEFMEIDFDGPIPQEALWDLEIRANDAVFADLPIRCWYPSREELPQIPYRTKKQLPWPVRIVEIPGIDQCACCGVHTARTGQIGPIKIVSCIKFHQGVRLQLCCGGRALRLLQNVFEQNRQVSQIFSAKLLETGEAARKMADALAAEKLRANTLQRAVFSQVAESLRGCGNVLLFREGLVPGDLRELTDQIFRVCGGWAAVCSGQEGAYSICVLGNAQDVQSIGQALKQQLQARGGGKAGSFQGSLCAKKDQIEALFRSFQ